MTIFGGRHIVIPPLMQMRTRGPKTAAAPAGNWWEVTGKTTVAAYQPKGAASYTASLVNLANPGTNDAVCPVAPDWASGTGWYFDGSDHMTVPFVPSNDQSWSVLIRFANGATDGNRALFGYVAPAPSYRPQFFIGYYWSGNMFISNGDAISVSPVTSGVVGFAGATAYVDGDSVGSIPSATGTFDRLFIGAVNLDGTLYGLATANILAVVFFSDTLTAGQVATVSAAMAAL